MRRGATVSGTSARRGHRRPDPRRTRAGEGSGWINRSAAAAASDLKGGPEASTDAEGAFRLAQVPDSFFAATVAITASAPGHVDALEVLSNLGDGREVRTEVRLWPAGSIRGRVVDARGRPVAGVSVAVDSWSWLLAIDTDAAPDRAPCLSGPDGEYLLEHVAAAPQGVPVLAKRLTGQHAWGMLESVRVTAGEPTRAPDLVVTVAPAATLRVVDADGRPVAGALVEVANQEVREWFTRGDGRVLVSFARDGEKTKGLPAYVRVTAPGYVDLETPAFIPDVDAPPEVVVKLARAAELRCHAVWSDGRDAAGIQVTVARGDVPISSIWPLRNEAGANLAEDPTLASVETDARGRCRIKGLPRGPWHVAAWREARDSEPAVRIAAVIDASRELVPGARGRSPPPAPAVETTDVDVAVVYSDSLRPVLDATVYVDNETGHSACARVFRRARVPRGPRRGLCLGAGVSEDDPTQRRPASPGSERIEFRDRERDPHRGRALLPAGMTLTGAIVYATFGTAEAATGLSSRPARSSSRRAAGRRSRPFHPGVAGRHEGTAFAHLDRRGPFASRRGSARSISATSSSCAASSGPGAHLRSARGPAEPSALGPDLAGARRHVDPRADHPRVLRVDLAASAGEVIARCEVPGAGPGREDRDDRRASARTSSSLCDRPA